jgi:hypothetical protein
MPCVFNYPQHWLLCLVTSQIINFSDLLKHLFTPGLPTIIEFVAWNLFNHAHHIITSYLIILVITAANYWNFAMCVQVLPYGCQCLSLRKLILLMRNRNSVPYFYFLPFSLLIALLFSSDQTLWNSSAILLPVNLILVKDIVVPVHAMKTHRGVELYLLSLLTSAFSGINPILRSRFIILSKIDHWNKPKYLHLKELIFLLSLTFAADESDTIVSGEKQRHILFKVQCFAHHLCLHH